MELQQLDVMALTPPLNITHIKTVDDLKILEAFFARCNGEFGWDIETTPLKDFFYRRIRTFQFGNQTEQFFIDLRDWCDGGADGLYAAQGNYGRNLPARLKVLVEFLKPYLCTRDYLKVGVMLSFEYMNHYWLLGLRTCHFWDCSIVEKCIYAGAHSMKDYGFYSMESMMARYFRVQIDKKYQESFTLEAEMIPEQVVYGVLDIRFPFAIKQAQTLVLQGHTAKSLAAKGSGAAKILANIDPIVTGDNLMEIAQSENDATGAFEDMHVHGEKMDKSRWLKRVNSRKAELATLISDVLDPIFLPIVGSKHEISTDAEIEAAEAHWKTFNNVTDAEIELKAPMRLAKKLGNLDEWNALEQHRATLAAERVQKKDVLKAACSEMKKKRTKVKNLAAKCEGDALINYGSDAQLLAVIQGMKGLKKIDKLDDDMLEQYEHIAVMAAIRKYHGLSKEIGTYGDQWAQEWKTKPCKEEGWLHPGDGRLHCVFNQYDAETGRSSSEKPNGQNLPQDKEVRSSFVADDPDETIRISNCCNADTSLELETSDRWCDACGEKCGTHAEDYVLITCDMSGAELRIIAELADDPLWCGAFNRGEDVHSVGTEVLFEDGSEEPALHAWRPPAAEVQVPRPRRTPERQQEHELPPGVRRRAGQAGAADQEVSAGSPRPDGEA